MSEFTDLGTTASVLSDGSESSEEIKLNSVKSPILNVKKIDKHDTVSKKTDEKGNTCEHQTNSR